MKYFHYGDRIGIACRLCEPPSLKECVGCRRRVNPQFPPKEIWINNTKYVLYDREGAER